MRTVTGNLLDATDDWIVHQTNCMSSRSKGLASSIFRVFPHADVYNNRGRDQPGTIAIRGTQGPDSPRGVIAIHGQIYPGPARRWDSREMRHGFFRAGLSLIADELGGGISLGFPFGIGCGLAGGEWSEYQELLQQFARAHPQIEITLYRFANRR